MNNSDKISIIIPVYNVENELQRCVQSVKQQTYDNLEVILVDDGSTDRSGDLCDEFSSNDARFRVIHKENGGLSSARNAGLKSATGVWLLYVDSDDVIEPDTCESFIRTSLLTGADLIVGDAVHETSNGNELMTHNCLEPNRAYGAKDGIVKLIRNGQFFAPAWLNLYRTSMLIDNELYFEEGLLHEDMEMQPRLFLAVKSFAYTGHLFYHYIYRSTSIMNAGKRAERNKAMQHIYSKWKKQFDAVTDKELQEALFGYLAKCYLHSSRELGEIDLHNDGITARFLYRYGLNNKEKIKAIAYAMAPRLWASAGINHISKARY